MAKKSNLIKLGDAISELFRQEKLDVKLSQHAVRNGWKEIAGEMIARNTSSLVFHGNTLFITLTSAALKHELSFRRSQLLENINKFCGYKLVAEVVIR